ncbi:hypothetical protein M0R45_016061 [Rubus argutus]|uniref:Uncharacterized protein n=1 Tax=Rubus argutus TaxID=59490 RepID=A0AAW1XSE6_RUBAR
MRAEHGLVRRRRLWARGRQAAADSEGERKQGAGLWDVVDGEGNARAAATTILGGWVLDFAATVERPA